MPSSRAPVVLLCSMDDPPNPSSPPNNPTRIGKTSSFHPERQQRQYSRRNTASGGLGGSDSFEITRSLQGSSKATKPKSDFRLGALAKASTRHDLVPPFEKRRGTIDHHFNKKNLGSDPPSKLDVTNIDEVSPLKHPVPAPTIETPTLPHPIPENSTQQALVPYAQPSQLPIPQLPITLVAPIHPPPTHPLTPGRRTPYNPHPDEVTLRVKIFSFGVQTLLSFPALSSPRFRYNLVCPSVLNDVQMYPLDLAPGTFTQSICPLGRIIPRLYVGLAVNVRDQVCQKLFIVLDAPVPPGSPKVILGEELHGILNE